MAKPAFKGKKKADDVRKSDIQIYANHLDEKNIGRIFVFAFDNSPLNGTPKQIEKQSGDDGKKQAEKGKADASGKEIEKGKGEETRKQAKRDEWFSMIKELDGGRNMYIVKDKYERMSINGETRSDRNLTVFSKDGEIDCIALMRGWNSKTKVKYDTGMRVSFYKFINDCDSFIMFGSAAVDVAIKSMRRILAALKMGGKEVSINEKYVFRE